MRRPLLRICLVAISFGTAFLLGRWSTASGHRDAGKYLPETPVLLRAAKAGARPVNPGLATLREKLARQLSSGKGPFTGAEFERLVADRSGTGEETAESFAARWARADPAGLAEWILQTRWKPPYVTWVLFHTWAQNDEKSARAAWDKFPAHQKTERREAIGAMIAGLGSANPAAAGALARAHLPLLAGVSPAMVSSPFFIGFKQSDAFWNVIAALPGNADRNKVLAAYLNFSAHNDDEVKRRWTEASGELRRGLVAGGFPNGKRVEDEVFDGLPAMILEQAAKTGDRNALYSGLREQVRRNPGLLGESVMLTQEKMTGRNRAEFPAELISLAAQQDFPKALDFWRSLPDGLLKVRAAGALEKAAPLELKSTMEAEISRLAPADIKRARGAG